MIKGLIKQTLGYLHCKRHNIMAEGIPQFGRNVLIINKGWG